MGLTVGLGPASASGGGGGGGTSLFRMENVAIRVQHTDKTIEEFPVVDTSLVTDMESMFKDHTKLKTIPVMVTSNVTNMAYMFSNCSSLTAIPQMDTSKVTQMSSFCYMCKKLVSVPVLDMSSCITLYQAFIACESLKELTLLNTMKVPNMAKMFQGCVALETIQGLNVGNVTGNDLTTAFKSCSNLKEIRIVGLRTDITLSDSPNLSKESILCLFENAKTVNVETITLHADVFAQLTEDEIAIAAEKGFSVVG